MSRFQRMHPLVQLMFFLLSLVLPFVFYHPAFTLASLVGAWGYAFVSNGRKAWKTTAFSMTVILAVGVFNMLFAHYGEDVLFHIGAVDFTLEALLYGCHQGMILSSGLVWFTFFGRILDSERLIYLFRFSPKIALTFSIVLGFIPRFLRKLGDIRTARLALHGGQSESGIKGKFRGAMNDFSALVSYSLEAGMLTAQSMTARNYRPKAVSARRFAFSMADAILLGAFILLMVYTVMVKVHGDISFIFEPVAMSRRLSIPALAAFLVMELSISVIDITETVLWKQSSVKK